MKDGLFCGGWLSFLLFIFAPSLLAQINSTLPVYTVEGDNQEPIKLGDSLLFFLDTTGQYDIQDVLLLPDDLFVQSPPFASGGGPFFLWTRIKLRNPSQESSNFYANYCVGFKSIWMYSLAEGSVLGQQYSSLFQGPEARAVPAPAHFLSLSLEAGTERTYFFRLLVEETTDVSHRTHLSLHAQKPLHHRLAASQIWQAFYAGVMLLFCIFSLFLSRIFRERSFAYFSLQTFFFILYFMEASGLVETFFTNWFLANDINLSIWLVSGLVGSIFLFTAHRLAMRRQLPGLYKVYSALSLLCVCYPHLLVLLRVPMMTIVISYNILLAAWLVCCLVAIIILAQRRNRDAFILLVSLIVLALGALFFLLSYRLLGIYTEVGFAVFQAGTVLSSGILFYGLFDRINTIRGEKQRMEELDALKSRFFANISHEFRTPLTLMMGPLQQLAERAQEPEQRELLAMAQRNARRQLVLVNQLLELSTLEAEKMELGATTQDFIPFLKGVVQAYDSLAEQKGIGLSVECPEGKLLVNFSEEKMETIFYNLLSNAFKFTANGGRISVILKRENGRLAVAVSDTGTGIAATELPHIFDRFFQAEIGKNEAIQGSGIGLALTKELVELHGGDISVESVVGKGTRFVLHFPLAAAAATPREVAAAALDAPLVLIVEDNEDVRAFIRLRLASSFRIIEAADGQAGIEKAFELMPDLIISDVMMPKKNGYEVCQTLKTDLHTCHIPIILLTAKAAQTEKLAGLETGADDYLTKPFDSRELLVRVQNLIQLRQQLRQRFADAIHIKPSEIVTNAQDQVFLEQALEFVETSLRDEQFSVDALAAKLGMSRTNLNRKLRALVNQSSNQFIQSVRLQRAADLLQQQAATVAEVALQTGFSSTAYFIKCFKDKFGETPGSFSEKA